MAKVKPYDTFRYRKGDYFVTEIRPRRDPSGNPIPTNFLMNVVAKRHKDNERFDFLWN